MMRTFRFKVKDSIQFFLPHDPPKMTAQQKGVRVVGKRAIHYKKAALREIEDRFLEWLAPYAPEKPLVGACSLHVSWTYRWRERDLTPTGKKRAPIAGKLWVPCDTRPDCSNIVKLFEDCMTKAGFFKDDSQVADLRVVKGWGDMPGIGVIVGQIQQPITKETK